MRRSMSAIRLDLSCPPIVLTVFRGKQTDQDVDAYIAAMDAMYARRRRYAGVSLMLQYSAEPRHLRRIAEWTRKTKPLVADLCVGAAMVAPSPGFRFILSSLLVIQPLPVSYQVVGTVDEAGDWIANQLAQTKLTAPSTMRDYLRAQMSLEGG
jgi:hypothetical protein